MKKSNKWVLITDEQPTNEVVSFDRIKEHTVVGQKFLAPTGSVGTILPDLDSKSGKVQGRMTCTAGGPDHVRLCSDFHQCGKSPEKSGPKKSSSRKQKSSPVTPLADELEASLTSLTPEQATNVKQELENKLQAQLN